MSKEVGTAESENAEPETQTVRSMTIDIRQLKGECGRALVEYAIVFLLFMTMIMGTIDFGRALTLTIILSKRHERTRRDGQPSTEQMWNHRPIGDNSCNGQGYMGHPGQPPVRRSDFHHEPDATGHRHDQAHGDGNLADQHG